VVDVGHSRDSGEKPEEEEEPTEPKESDSTDETATDSPKPKAKKRRAFWIEMVVLIAIALVLTTVIQTFVARVFLIPSESMEQTLHGCPNCYGDRVLVDKVTYLFHDPRPGDVVVFERPSTWSRSDFGTQQGSDSWLRKVTSLLTLGVVGSNEDDVVKRVIAVGGQTVRCCDEQGRVEVNGSSLDEPYIYWTNGAPDGRQEFGEITIPDGMLWVMGDNRNNSSDSRFQGGGGIAGLVPVDNVIGKARYVVLPPSRWQGVGDHNPQVAVAAALSTGIPLGVGFAAAFPVLWFGKRVIRRRRR
jgi:signal peptidase I